MLAASSGKFKSTRKENDGFGEVIVRLLCNFRASFNEFLTQLVENHYGTLRISVLN